MATPHISAPAGAFADTVLLPGDPLRAEHIATRLLDDAREVTRVRAMAGFTGSWRGMPVSVMGSGMGIPSASIYATELIREYGVRRLVRIGTCGAIAGHLQLGDIVLAQGACTDSGVNRSRFGGMDFAAIADFGLLSSVAAAARAAEAPVAVGNVFSADLFYHPDRRLVDTLDAMGVLAVEMEAAGLYGVAAGHGVHALAVCVVSDHLRRDARWTAQQRVCGVDDMVRLVLDALAAHLPPFKTDGEAINCHHNYVTRENHFGENVLVTRKGAVRAAKGVMGIIPGSMGAKSFIVRGLGNPDSFDSCSHGAGRVTTSTRSRTGHR